MDDKEIIQKIKEEKKALKQFKKESDKLVNSNNTDDSDTDYGVGEDISQEEYTDDTNFGIQEEPEETDKKTKIPKPSTKPPKREIKQYTEEELRRKLQEKMEQAKKPKLTTTMIVKALSALDKIKKNTGMILLLLHSLFCIVCGGILALGFFLQHFWLQAGGGFTAFVTLITLLLTYLSPKGDLSEYLESPNLLDELNKLSHNDFQKLWNEINNTRFFQ